MCVRCAHTLYPLLYLSIPHFLSPHGGYPIENVRPYVDVCLMKEGEKERQREGGRERERVELFWCMFPRDAAPDRKSGSHALCLAVLVTFRGTHGLSLHPTGPSLPPVPASGPRRRDDVFLLVEHASRLPVPSLVQHLLLLSPALCSSHHSLVSWSYYYLWFIRLLL